MSKQHEVTRILEGMREGDREAVNALLPYVYDELHNMAHRQLGRYRPGRTLNTTALVHEAYFRLVDPGRATINDRQHFYSVAALAMRQIVVDYARRRRAAKRGGGAHHTVLDELEGSALAVDAQADAILALDMALKKLTKLDERLVKVVELRFFGGMSVEETAGALGVSTPTVKRDTRIARAFLQKELGG